MKVFLAMMLVLACSVCACTERKAAQLLETAKFEEVQRNPAHAEQLYREIVDAYPNSSQAVVARERLKELQKAGK